MQLSFNRMAIDQATKAKRALISLLNSLYNLYILSGANVAQRPILHRFCIAQQCHYCENTGEGR